MSESDLDLEEIEARLAAITPGGWKYWWVDDEERFRLDLIEGDRFIAKKVWDEVDAQFIANAPTDIAALIAEVKRLRRQINQQAEDDHNQHAPDDLFFPPYPDEVKE